MNKNFSLYGLPEKVEFCKLCTMNNQKPNPVVEFKNSDNQKKGIKISDGICDACKYAEMKKTIDWEKREKELVKLLDKYRRKNGYDCVVPGSGGKDSCFAAHILKYKYNMNPLTVTWAPHLYTDIGFKNFTNWIHIGGFDNVLFTPNGKLHRYLTRLAFMNLLHPFQPFIVGQKNIGPRIASKFNIPLVIYGENTSEYGSSIDENFDPVMDQKYFTSSSKDIYFGKKKITEILKETDFKISDFEPYYPLQQDEVGKKDIKVFHLGYFYKWDPQEMFYYASENLGFKPNNERTEGTYSKYNSIDDKIDNLHYYTTYIKFGVGRASYDTAQEIRNGKITREEGVSLVRKYDNEFPSKYFSEFLNYLDIDEKTFFETVDNFRSPHLWKKQNNRWILKHKL
tara:strand:+ start:201 stop:1391 length:1191 start_codon:yes stop_codon:yes gene_type:complete